MGHLHISQRCLIGGRRLELASVAPSGTHRRRLAVAAAAMLIIGVAGVWAVATNRNGGESLAPAQQPPTGSLTAPQETTLPSGSADAGVLGQEPGPSSEPTSFPTFEVLPVGLSATAHVQQIAPGAISAYTEALIGRLTDGVVNDAVNITVQTTPFRISTAVGDPVTDAVVTGEPAKVVDRAGSGELVLVAWGSGPYFVASGASPLAFLNQIDPGVIYAEAASDSARPPELIVGSLPDDFELIAGPQPVGQATLNATLLIGADNYEVSVSTRNPIPQMALVGPLRAIEVAGRPAWTGLSATPTQDITWQVDDATYAYLKINDGASAAHALDLANRITFVDFDTWISRYRPDTATVSATTEPAAD